MAQWGRNDHAVTANSVTTKESSNGAPIGTYALVKGDQKNRVNGANAHFGNTSPGTRAGVDVNMFNNTSPNAFLTNQAVGVFGVSALEMANNTANASKENPAHAGWVVRRAGTGPVVGVTAAAGSGFVTGETITVSNGSSNATITITANATGNIGSVSITNAGNGWTNTGMAVVAFDRQKHITAFTQTNASASGYSNTDYVTISNATNVIVAGRGNVVTGTGVSNLASVTLTSNGLFKNAQLAAGLVITVYAANGAASNGTGATWSTTLANSAGGTATITLGGRAGRVHTETLVAMGSLGVNATSSTGVTGNANTTADASTDNTQYPGR